MRPNSQRGAFPPCQCRLSALGRPDQEDDPAALEYSVQGLNMPVAGDHGDIRP